MCIGGIVYPDWYYWLIILIMPIGLIITNLLLYFLVKSYKKYKIPAIIISVIIGFIWIIYNYIFSFLLAYSC